MRFHRQTVTVRLASGASYTAQGWGFELDTLPGVPLVAHKSPGECEWIVTEPETGQGVILSRFGQTTRRSAVTAAAARVNKMGLTPDEVRAHIAKILAAQ